MSGREGGDVSTNEDGGVPMPPATQAYAFIKNQGDSWELFGLYIMNMVLTFLTLGIYRFWGKTRIRRYLWGNLEVLGDRLEYTGTGKELFLGFLLVFFVILLPLFGGIAVIDNMLIGVNEDARVVLALVQFVLILFFIGVAFFRARRYRLTRTYWRGISGAQTGSAVKYGLMNLAAQVINIFTVWLAMPATTVWLKRYEMKHTWVGDEQPEFTPSVKKLYGPFLVPWICVAASSGLFLMMAVPLILKLETGEKPSHDELMLIGGMIGLGYALIIPFALSMWWYRGKVYNHFVSATRFHGHDFASTISGLSYMWLALTNSLLVVVTLGLGVPFTYQRTLAYAERRVSVVGDYDFDDLFQSTHEKPGTGEGLADAFDIGAI